MRRTTKIVLISLAALLVLLVAARLVAPIFVLRYVNNTLQGLDGFTGHVADIELSLWRGAYVIEGVTIEKTTKQEPLPFVSVDRADISVHWGPLLRGNLVAEIELLAPKLNLLAERKAEPKAEDKVEKLWEGIVEVVKDVVENDEKKQVATRVPFSGRIDNPSADVIETLIIVLQNAFIQALRRGLEPVTGGEGISRRDNN